MSLQFHPLNLELHIASSPGVIALVVVVQRFKLRGASLPQLPLQSYNFSSHRHVSAMSTLNSRSTSFTLNPLYNPCSSSRLGHHCARSLPLCDATSNSINAAAAVRRYDVDPRLDYRTVSGVNGKPRRSYVWPASTDEHDIPGPLVVLDNVKFPSYNEVRYEPAPSPSVRHSSAARRSN